MYPVHVRDSISVNNIDWVGDLYKRNLYQHAGTREDIGIKVPTVLALSLRNLYQFWKQVPEKLHLKMPKVLSLDIRNLFRQYTSTPTKMHIKLPQVVSLYLRSYLQKLFSYPLDDIFVVHLPQVVDLHKKNIVSKYIEDEYGKLNIQVPEVTEMSLRNVLQKYQHEGETVYLTLPQGIEITGTTKPYIRSPVLSGSLIAGEVFNIDLEWQDESLTHTGYLLYRDTAPIGADTELEPIQEFDRYTFVYEDWDLEEDTTYYYRITPKSIYGRFFSNLLSLYVPLYLRAPRDFVVGYQSLSQPVDGEGSIQSLTAILSVGTRYLSTEEISSISGEYAYQIFMEDPVAHLAKVESPYQLTGTSKLEHILHKENARYRSLKKAGINYVEFFNDISLYGESTHLNKVLEPENIERSFAGITKGFIRDTFVILGSLIENRQQTYDSVTEPVSIIGHGSREMILHQPEAFILHGGQLSAIAGVFSNATHMSNEGYYYSGVNAATEAAYSNYSDPVNLSTLEYSYVPVNKATGEGSYEDYLHVRNPTSEYLGYRLSNISGHPFGLTAVDPQRVYCVLGSDAYGVECEYTKAVDSFGIQARMLTLAKPFEVETAYYEDQEFTIFSGYLPPVGYPMEYSTYRVGTSIIPVFAAHPTPGDSTSFTLYEKMYRSREIRTGYTPPKGTEIRFSLFVED